MACGRNASKAAEAACAGGISKSVSTKTFYLSATAAGLLTISGIWLSRRLLQQVRKLSMTAPDQLEVGSLLEQDSTPKLKTLVGQERVEPVSVDKLIGDACFKCKVRPRHKSGAWYRLQSQIYCQDCARDKAREIGATLVASVTTAVPPPTIASIPSAQSTSRPGRYKRKVNLKPTWVSLGAIKNVEGYEVILPGGTKTGLTISPEVKLEGDGRLNINKLRWFVNYERAGRSIGGPYESLNQAKGMASLMAQFDWNRPPESFTKKEAEAITAAANAYRADIEEEKFLKQQADSFSS